MNKHTNSYYVESDDYLPLIPNATISVSWDCGDREVGVHPGYLTDDISGFCVIKYNSDGPNENVTDTIDIETREAMITSLEVLAWSMAEDDDSAASDDWDRDDVELDDDIE